jgi:hypothetical protein
LDTGYSLFRAICENNLQPVTMGVKPSQSRECAVIKNKKSIKKARNKRAGSFLEATAKPK